MCRLSHSMQQYMYSRRAGGRNRAEREPLASDKGVDTPETKVRCSRVVGMAVYTLAKGLDTKGRWRGGQRSRVCYNLERV